MSTELIYLDYAAATPMDERVISAMQPYFNEDFFNPSSPYMPAVKVRRAFDDAKQTLANLIGAKSGAVIMTAGATESINLAFNWVTSHVVVPNIEHHAVLACAKVCDHTIVKADSRGYVSADVIKESIRLDTELVSVALVNNELGIIQPIRAIAEIVKNERNQRLASGNLTPIFLHCDASQGAGQIDINVARLGVDMMTLNAGKIYGPKQVGLLWADSQVQLAPQIIGGGQERGMRSGTENVAGTIGFAKALQLAVEHRAFESDRLTKIRDDLQQMLTGAFPEAVVSGYGKHRLASYLHISFPGIDAERLIFILENRGVLVASGSACAANKGTRSHVLTAIGLPPELADGSIRITLGHQSTSENIDKAGKIMIEEINNEYTRLKR